MYWTEYYRGFWWALGALTATLICAAVAAVGFGGFWMFRWNWIGV